MRKLIPVAYYIGTSLYNYYLKRMSENLIEQPKRIEGVLYREGLQYYLQRVIGDRYAIRALDVHEKGITRLDISKRFTAEIISDPSVVAPEGFVAYCYKLEEVK